MDLDHFDLDSVVDAADNLSDLWFDPKRWKRWITIQTIKSYSRYMYAAAPIVFIGSIGGPPAISNLHSERLDPKPHIPSVANGSSMADFPTVTSVASWGPGGVSGTGSIAVGVSAIEATGAVINPY